MLLMLWRRHGGRRWHSHGPVERHRRETLLVWLLLLLLPARVHRVVRLPTLGLPPAGELGPRILKHCRLVEVLGSATAAAAAAAAAATPTPTTAATATATVAAGSTAATTSAWAAAWAATISPPAESTAVTMERLSATTMELLSATTTTTWLAIVPSATMASGSDHGKR